MDKKSWGAFGFNISILLKVLDEIVMGDFSSFLESVLSTLDFSIDIAINCFVVKVVMLDDFRWNEVILELYLLGVGEKGT